VTVDEYIASKPQTVRPLLEALRATIRKALPDADESISYHMPTYKVRGAPVIYFAAWKKHYSLYPATAHVIAALKDELAPYEVEKGTIRFPLTHPVPVRLIARIANLRAEEVGHS
jgi:uncharacterized protein YdhG (YjbR/CyaY superfamily)